MKLKYNKAIPIKEREMYKKSKLKAIIGTQHVASYQFMENDEKYYKQISADMRGAVPEEDLNPVAFDILTDLSDIDFENKCFSSEEMKKKMIGLICHKLYHDVYTAKYFLDCLLKEGKINGEVKITKRDICDGIMAIEEID